MMLRRPKDSLTGLVFLLIATGTWLLCRELSYGTARNMGPGYFPILLSWLLTFLGGVLIVRSFFGSIEPVDPMSWRALRSIVAVLASCVLFGLLVRPAGLAVAVMATVLTGVLGMQGYGLRSALLTAIVLAVGCCLTFVALLGLPIPVVGPLLGM
ncbi:tripartite tricarboxylate transporter TctB family protein [Chelatococcus asaccharovorans]|uniref:Putative tricarboxylic transport membrane protein n=1 Tax=Chelatococcus asaccharovorans TaxID=28210 RepID=A0A2V3TSA1_9HYPH|nr:tripartite tricarboxylate transporter TctB family protein [Chelatococcus asaccharovorans]MBS7708136.1 tripartite tricarboxylate transporter TctB family protein [Chelatococcus asaccharovorans]PXW50694.1 putative tricarboxylic transport membrane protein [Chelatococcus asaccharovorans]